MKDFSTPKFGKSGRRTVSNSVHEEQIFVDDTQALLNAHIAHLRQRIKSTTSAPGTGTGQDEVEREALLDNLNQQLHAALAARAKICFGRIQLLDDTDHHIGRIGLRKPDGDIALVDWRAPQAAPFYQATTQDPMGLSLRRRIATRSTPEGPEVTHVDDETFTGVSDSWSAGAVAMDAPRTGRMADILATIAADQDAIIRSPLEQITVVQGGPGTGKTVVALHRAAWLLYTYRDRLSRDAVLIIGPSRVFLHYIDQVLPSLGETDVVLLTPSQLYPDVKTDKNDEPEVSRIKGDARMATVIERAISARVRLPQTDVLITTATGTRVYLTPEQVAKAARGISRTRHYHDGREPFLRRLLMAAAQNIAIERGRDPDDADYCHDIIASLVEDPNVRREFNLMWLPTTPERVIGQLLTDPQVLADAADGVLTDKEQRFILRRDTDDWKVDDIPLLDEAAHVLGPWSMPKIQRTEEYRELQASDAYSFTSDRSAHRSASVAERALEDREWIYGHVIVDEAQELSAMAWRGVQRRSSRKSMTVVGDLQQSSHPASPRTWSEALAWGANKVQQFSLNVTYRITRQIADAATKLLIAAGGEPPVLTPIRDGQPVVYKQMSWEQLPDYLDGLGPVDGRNAVIVPNEAMNLAQRVLTGSNYGFGEDALDAPIAVLTAQQSKGLEFDSVVLADVAGISRQHTRGADVYVAATRATQVLHLIDMQDT